MRAIIFFLRAATRIFSWFLDSLVVVKIINKKTNKLYGQYRHERVGIIIQGPPVYQDDFTLNIIKRYKNQYPSSIIVVSAWDDTDASFISETKRAGAVLLLSEKPAPGISNINLQIHTTKVALEYLEPLVDYVLKSRSDQICDCQNDWIGYFLNLQKAFPVLGGALENRLIISSLGSYKNRLYGIPDFFMFGSFSDMNLFWAISPDERESSERKVELDPDLFIKEGVAEGYLVSQFCKNVGFQLKWDVTDSRKFIAHYFCVVDKEVIGHFWFKYRWEFENFTYAAGDLKLKPETKFSNWLDSYLKYKY